MHAKKRMEAFHDPFFSQVLPWSSSSSNPAVRQKIEDEDEGRGRTRLVGS
jgi:hypothetical protein